jgi:hypothetical protein
MTDTIPAAGHVAGLLAALGYDVTSNGLANTPRRVAAALAELTAGETEDPGRWLATVFDVSWAHDEMIALRGMDFASLCEHHPGSPVRLTPDTPAGTGYAGTPSPWRVSLSTDPLSSAPAPQGSARSARRCASLPRGHFAKRTLLRGKHPHPGPSEPLGSMPCTCP